MHVPNQTHMHVQCICYLPQQYTYEVIAIIQPYIQQSVNQLRVTDPYMQLYTQVRFRSQGQEGTKISGSTHYYKLPFNADVAVLYVTPLLAILSYCTPSDSSYQNTTSCTLTTLLHKGCASPHSSSFWEKDSEGKGDLQECKQINSIVSVSMWQLQIQKG